jgi:hypothetical protein
MNICFVPGPDPIAKTQVNLKCGLLKVERRKNRGDEPIRVIIYMYVEMLQGNSLRSYLKQKFLLTKLKNRRGWYQWEGRGCGGKDGG